ncbi:hypothetical protein [Roseobacter sp.]|uniref:hypothetical protein n=1 Tax=Roseobacter sp. TaxID=1907202 RepID=UPI00329A790E
MQPRKISEDCHRDPAAKEHRVEEAGLDAVDIVCLDILRFFISTFAEPQSQNWMRGFARAAAAFGPTNGPVVAARLIALLQAVRRGRRSMFMYSNPDCPGCCKILTEHERRLICAINGQRHGRPQLARLQLMMLCEGNSTDAVLVQLDAFMTTLAECPLHHDGAVDRADVF